MYSLRVHENFSHARRGLKYFVGSKGMLELHRQVENMERTLPLSMHKRQQLRPIFLSCPSHYLGIKYITTAVEVKYPSS